MAPREAGPARRVPGFRRRAFWFRSNSALAAGFLLPSQPLLPPPLLPPPPPERAASNGPVWSPRALRRPARGGAQHSRPDAWAEGPLGFLEVWWSRGSFLTAPD